MRQVKDRVVQHPHRYKLVPVAGTTDTYDLERVPGTVTEEGTAVNRQLFNSIDSALLCTHSKSGTVHTFTLNSAVAAFVPGQTIYTVKAALTASIEVGDTFTLTDGTTSYTGIVPKTSEGGNYRVTLFQNLSPVVIFEVNLGGSAKHAFFRGGGQKRLYREVFTVSGTWTCPDFVDEVYVQAFGGGGGGGAGKTNAGSTSGPAPGGGGGGGYMASGLIRVTPGAKYAVVIGKGGAGGLRSYNASTGSYSYGDGTDGGTSSFGGTSVVAHGGKGGGGNDGTAAHPGNGGNGSAGGGRGGTSGTVGTSAQFGAAAGGKGGDGYGINSVGGRVGVMVTNNIYGTCADGGGGGGASYGPGGDGASHIKDMHTTAAADFGALEDRLVALMVGRYGGGGGGGGGYTVLISGNPGDNQTFRDGGNGGDGILFLSYYADPSMMGSRKPEEFDVQTNGTEVSVTAATVAETVETMVAADETTGETDGETHETNETTQAAEDAAETEENV